MKQPSDNKEDWRNEKGVQDASFQDFVAPLLAGLGGVPRGIAAVKGLMSKAPAVAAGLETVPQMVNKFKKLEEQPDLSKIGGSGEVKIQSVLNRLELLADTAQAAGDAARLRAYKWLHLALDNSQISPDQIDYLVNIIQADPQGL